MNKKTLIVCLLIVAVTLILMGASYAYFTAIGTSDEQVVQSGVLELTYLTGKDITLEGIFPSEEVDAGVHQFAVENTGTLDATYYMYLDNIVLQKNGQDTHSENLKWKLYSADENYIEQSEIINGSFIDGNSTIELDTELAIRPGEKHYYILKIWLQETGQAQNEDQGLTFSAQVIATTEQKTINKALVDTIKTEAVPDNIASEFVTSPTGIDFGRFSSDTNGKGLYTVHGTENNPNPIMYYRGDVKNNNVKFANFCWKIVRTTETGGVKLIYNGEPDENGQCTAMWDDTTIGTSSFNANSNDNAYVGYMYGTPGSSTYEDTHKNTNDSTVKSVIDTWYSENLASYTAKLEDTVWCNDRSFTSGTGIGNTETAYSPYSRILAREQPTLECSNENDRFTVSEANGNGALTYPIALLTADEAVYAGTLPLITQTNKDHYLYNNDTWWLLSPYWHYEDDARVMVIYQSGNLGNDNVFDGDYCGVRPAISLKKGTKVEAGGDGTVENPYVVK